MSNASHGRAPSGCARQGIHPAPIATDSEQLTSLPHSTEYLAIEGISRTFLIPESHKKAFISIITNAKKEIISITKNTFSIIFFTLNDTAFSLLALSHPCKGMTIIHSPNYKQQIQMEQLFLLKISKFREYLPPYQTAFQPQNKLLSNFRSTHALDYLLMSHQMMVLCFIITTIR